MNRNDPPLKQSRSRFSKGANLAMLLGIITVAAFGAFSPSLSNGFTNWDDDKLILDNELIHEISFESLGAMWQEGLVGYQGPLAVLSLAIDYRIDGLNPRVFHATALVLHILTCWVLFFLLRRLGLTALEALLGTLLFGLHPLRVESVAWAAERKDLICGLFFFGAMFFYQGWLAARSKLSYGLCLAAFLLSLLAKPMAVTLPFVFLAQDYLARRPWSRAQILEKLPFIAVAAAAAALAVEAQKGAMPAPGVIDLWNSGLVAARGVAFYVYKTVLPIQLSAFYPYPEKIGILEPQFLVPLIVLVLLGVAALLAADRSRRPIFVFLFFLLTLVPVLKIVPIGNTAAADRYTYIPSAGLVFLAAGLAGSLVRWLWDRRDIAVASVFLAALGAVSAALGLAAHERCKIWRDSVTLWEDVIAKQPKVALARYNLGLALRERGDHAGALEQYREAIKLDPGHAGARNNIAFILRLEGDSDRSKGKAMEADRKYAEAETLCREALRLEPEMWEASLNLSFILGTLGRYEEALAAAHRALQLNPESSEAWYAQGVSLYHLNRHDEAVLSLDRAVELDPELAEAAERVKERLQ